MCGIAGLIGASSHPEASFELATALFHYSEARGTDAAGFWGTERGNGRILYHKEQGKSSELVKKGIWQAVGNLDVDLLLMHARASSVGVGTAYTNSNNHPFVSADRSIGLVHNGRIPDIEYEALRKKYEVNTHCDSEMFLRIFEAGENPGTEFAEFDTPENAISARLAAIKGIWSQIIRGHMAVNIGERLSDGARRLWLFRNKHRPLWVVDLREYLGQVFWCSSPQIWQEAATSSKLCRPFLRKKIMLIEVPPEQVWMMNTAPDKPIIQAGQIRKFSVITGSFSTFDHQGPQIPLKKADSPVAEVITRLDEKGDIDYKSPDFPASVKKKEPPVSPMVETIINPSSEDIASNNSKRITELEKIGSENGVVRGVVFPETIATEEELGSGLEHLVEEATRLGAENDFREDAEDAEDIDDEDEWKREFAFSSSSSKKPSAEHISEEIGQIKAHLDQIEVMVYAARQNNTLDDTALKEAYTDLVEVENTLAGLVTILEGDR